MKELYLINSPNIYVDEFSSSLAHSSRLEVKKRLLIHPDERRKRAMLVNYIL